MPIARGTAFGATGRLLFRGLSILIDKANFIIADSYRSIISADKSHIVGRPGPDRPSSARLPRILRVDPGRLPQGKQRRRLRRGDIVSPSPPFPSQVDCSVPEGIHVAGDFATVFPCTTELNREILQEREDNVDWFNHMLLYRTSPWCLMQVDRPGDGRPYGISL
jgi:hypothetical protein